VQSTSGEYVKLLQQHHMIPSLSLPANPYDNASCESFLKTLKREDNYANAYRTLEHLAANIETFIDHYFNQCRLRSALGHWPPNEFKRESASRTATSAVQATRLKRGRTGRDHVIREGIDAFTALA
jgi:transposase InsO family protein